MPAVTAIVACPPVIAVIVKLPTAKYLPVRSPAVKPNVAAVVSVRAVPTKAVAAVESSA